MVSRKIAAIVPAAVAGLLLISTFFGSWYTIDEGQLGVKLRNGAVVGTSTPGLGFKLPFMEDIVKMSTRTEKLSWERLGAYSRDQQPTSVNIAANFRIDPGRVQEIYAGLGVGYAERVLWPAVQANLKNVFGRFSALQIVNERERLNQEVTAAVAQAVAHYGIIVEVVNIENVDFSDAYEQSIEQRMLAEVEVARLRQNSEREKVQAEIVETQAKAQATALREQAQAESEAIRLRGEAEASAIRARGAALRDNPALVDLTAAERWNGVLPTTMIPNGATPFVSVK